MMCGICSRSPFAVVFCRRCVCVVVEERGVAAASQSPGTSPWRIFAIHCPTWTPFKMTEDRGSLSDSLTYPRPT